MARPLKPFVRSGGYYPSVKYTPLVYPGGYTTLNAKNGKPEPIDTFIGKIARFLAKRSLPMVKLEANFTPIQDLHGQESPYPPGGGKNKCKTLTTAVTDNGITVTPNADGTITLKGTASAHTYIDLDTSFNSTLYAGYIFTGLPSTGTWNTTSVCLRISSQNDRVSIQDVSRSGGVYYNNTVEDNGSNLRLAIRIVNGYECPSGGLKLDLMLRASTESDTFAPYANECPITGHTGCNVVVDGKNLLDNTAVKTYSNWSASLVSGGDYPTSSNNKGLAVNVKAGVTYTISAAKADSSWPSYFYFCKYLNGTGTRLNFFRDGYESYTFTAEEGALYYLRMGSSNDEASFNSSMAHLSYIQLELGSTASDYEEFQGTTVTISFGTTVYGGKLTVFEDGSGQVDANRKIITMDGTQNVSASSNNRFYFGISEAKTINASNQNTDDSVMCDRAKPLTWGALSYDDRVGATMCCAPVYGNGIAFRWDAITTAADWKTYFQNNPTQFSYELKNPITIPLTASQINTLVGENVVWVNDANGDITVQAYGTEIS